jgi:CRP/FNR family transcriptional regulator, cyclic AMP receptor protein
MAPAPRLAGDCRAAMTELLLQDNFRLDAEQMAAIARHGVTREYRPRTVLVTEGEQTDALYIILEGKVRVFLGGDNGKEVALSVMGPGEYFGEMAFDHGPRSASVITIDRCRVLVVPAAEFADFVAKNPSFANHFIRKLIHHVRVLTQNVRSLALMDAYGRVARLLLESAVKGEGGARYIPERLTQVEIASRVGCSREMVSRILKDLVTGGYISMEPDRIVIHRQPPARW